MIFDHLKKSTQELHNEAEVYNDASKVLDNSITVEEYKDLLITNYGSYKPLENFIADNNDVLNNRFSSFAEFHKSNRIEKDLKCLGIISADLELPIFKPNMVTLSYLLGIIYVMEGSMMGGLMISKQMQKCEHLTTLPDQKFFNREVTQTLERWNGFKEKVEDIENQINTEEITSGANDAFAFFKKAHIFYSEKKFLFS